METYKLPPLINTRMTPEDLIGPLHDLLLSHYQMSQSLEGLKEDEFDKKMKSFGQENRDQCALLYKKLYQHGYRVSGIKKRRLAFGMAVRLPEENQIDVLFDNSDEKKTSLKAGKYRFRIVMMVYHKQISMEDGLAYQSMSNDAIIRIFETGGLKP